MPPDHPAPDRAALRRDLLVARERFVQSPAAAAAAQALQAHLDALLARLEPACLGVYWPMRSEFNAARRWCADQGQAAPALALPCALRAPPSMHYRAWDGGTPAARDEFHLPTGDGPRVIPDVVLVPCVGVTDDGYRLGYGGGFFDRYLAAHPDTTAVGVAWSVGRLAPGQFTPEPHDQPLMLVVTEAGIVG